MHQVQFVSGVLLLATGVLSLLASNALVNRLIRDINNESPPDEHIGPFFVNVRLFEIVALHRRLFPEHARPRGMLLVAVSGGLLFRSGFVLVVTSFR